MYQVEAMINKYEKSLNQILSLDNFFDFFDIEPKSEELKLQLKTFAKENLVEIFGSKKARLVEFIT